uniref:Uncharacterized protein n=1 Tax=Micrurus spixii TaxID=129469 RepID=A0A2D4ML44_9SAUR
MLFPEHSFTPNQAPETHKRNVQCIGMVEVIYTHKQRHTITSRQKLVFEGTLLLNLEALQQHILTLATLKWVDLHSQNSLAAKFWELKSIHLKLPRLKCLDT